mgnify:CR=1 FL=1
MNRRNIVLGEYEADGLDLPVGQRAVPPGVRPEFIFQIAQEVYVQIGISTEVGLDLIPVAESPVLQRFGPLSQ